MAKSNSAEIDGLKIVDWALEDFVDSRLTIGSLAYGHRLMVAGCDLDASLVDKCQDIVDNF